MPILQSISRFLQTVRQPFSLVSYVNHQKKFIKKNISPLLSEAVKSNDGSLNENDLKKITGYYGLTVPAVLGEAFCTLRRKPMTEKERLTITLQGATTGLGDDFFDKQRLPEQDVKKIIEHPELFAGNTASEKFFLQFYKTTLSNASNTSLAKAHLLRVFEAQLLSRQMEEPGLSYEVMKDITIRKGAESLLYYRTAFKHPLRNGEEKMLYSLGGLVQLGHDIFDVYNDHQNGRNTLATTATKIKDLRFYYSAILKISLDAAYRSAYPKKNIRKCLGIISLGIFSRCYVCLDQLEKNEKKSGGVFESGADQRNNLICDMDTVANKLKSFRYYLKISRKFH